MDLNRIWIYAVPLLCVAGIAAAIYYFLMVEGAPGSTRSGVPRDLLVIAEPDFRYPLEAPDVEHDSGVLGRFERRAGVRVRAEYRAPAEFFEQTGGERRGDLYLTSNRHHIDQAREAGLIAEAHSIARLVPVILVNRENPYAIQSVADLENPELRLGIAGAPSGLIGRVTAEIYEGQGVSTAHATFNGNSVADLARAVEQDRVDAAIVWRHVGARHSRNTRMIDIPVNKNVMSPVFSAVLAESQNPAAARLASFLGGGASHQVFELYGFNVGTNVKENGDDER